MNKIAILGGGMFGYAMANYLADKYPINLYDVDEELVCYLNENNKHKYHFRDVLKSPNIKASCNIMTSVEDCDLIVIAVPSKFIRTVIKEIKPYVKNHIKILNLSKGLELESKEIPSIVVEEELNDIDYSFATLTGGMIAKEFAEKKPLFAGIGSRDKEFLVELKELLTSDSFRLIVTEDIIGIELCGPLKNIGAIFAGYLQGKGYDCSTIGGFLTEFSKEAETIALRLGGEESTFLSTSPAWSGDLFTSCFGDSRNKKFGVSIGETDDVKSVLDEMKEKHLLIEGYINTKIFYDIARKKELKTPIIDSIYELLYENKKINISELMNKI
ncbi:NAD(P)-binding domain-containing protein [Candidatus Woesearchaeota archaeon]|nr:NAD(P)-binding domain-containing protein [Candidatus Woesearchaeota archaeon]